MPVVFQDNFTETSDTALGSHTPSPTGTSWTQLEKSGSPDLRVSGANDRVEATVGGNSQRVSYTADATYGSADYDVEITVAAKPTAGADDPAVILARIADSSNFYGLQFYHSAASPRFRLFKKVAGSFTALATESTTTLAAGNKLKLELRGTAIKGYIDQGSGYTQILSATDSSLTAAGKAGLGLGNLYNTSPGDVDDVATAWGLNAFVATTVASTNYTLDAASGAYAVTGSVANLRSARRLTSTAGDYAMTGTASGLRVSRSLNAASAAYAVAGVAATISRGKLFTADNGALTIAGTAAGMRVARLLSAATGGYVETGTVATLRPARKLGATAGAYAFTGTVVGLSRTRRVSTETALYTVAGTAAGVRAGRRLSLDAGGYAWIGASALFELGTTATVVGPYQFQRGQIYQPGIATGAIYIPGLLRGQVYQPGAQQGVVH